MGGIVDVYDYVQSRLAHKPQTLCCKTSKRRE